MKTKIIILPFLALIFLTDPLLANEIISGPKESPEKSVIAERSKFLILTLENDSLGSGVDKGYTNGVLVSYFDSGYRPYKLSAWMNKYFPYIPFNDHSKISYSIGQNMYTPEDIRIKEPQNDDRPWVGYLYGAIRSYTIFDAYADDLELTLGIIGPSAQAKFVQQIVHKNFVAKRYPSGWNNQLRDEPAVMLSYRRRWLQLLGGDISPLGISYAIEPNLGGSLGNIYTLAETGIMLRIMAKTIRWMDTPLLIRPSMPGSSFFYHKHDALNWQFFIGTQGRAIAHTVLLDGNTFHDSYSIQKRHFVIDVNAGIAIAYSNARLSYTAIFRTKEFYGQSKDSIYGNLNFGYSF